MATQRTTRTAVIFDQLRADILAGRLTPGAKLPFAELSKRFGVSMGVLREGLSRLAEQGLVVAEPQLGFRVTPLSVDDLVELTEARCEIEGTVLRLSIEQGDLQWESQVVAAYHTLERTPVRDEEDPARFNESWLSVHRLFHASLLAGCRNDRLLSIASNLRDSAELYRRWSLPATPDRDIPGEHAEMTEATVARQVDRAVGLLRAHIKETTDVLLGGAPTGLTQAESA